MTSETNVIDAEIVENDPRANALVKRIEVRLSESLAKYGPVLDSIESAQNLLQDRVVPLGKGGRIHFAADDNRLIAEINNGKSEAFTLHPHAAVQSGEKLGVPGAYIRDLAFGKEVWQRELAAHVLNQHAENGPRARVLVRAIGQEIRGVLSDQYRRLDSGVIVRSFLEGAAKAGLKLFRAELDDTQLSVQALYPQVFKVELPNHGSQFQTWGVGYRSSDFGDGASELSLFDFRCRCFNLSVAESAIRQVHLGGRLPDNVELSERTYKFDTRTQAGIVGDTIRHLFQPASIQKRMALLTDASAKVIENVDDSIKLLPKFGTTKGEAEAVREVLAKGDPDVIPEGPTTQYKLSQALSAVAQRAESPARRRDLEELAGKLLKK